MHQSGQSDLYHAWPFGALPGKDITVSQTGSGIDLTWNGINLAGQSVHTWESSDSDGRVNRRRNKHNANNLNRHYGIDTYRYT